MTATVHDVRAKRRVGRLTVAAVGAAQIASIAFGMGPPIQPLLSVVFVLAVPGFRLLDLDKPRDVSARVIVAVGASLSINTTFAALALVTDAPAVVLVFAFALWVAAVLPGKMPERPTEKAPIIEEDLTREAAIVIEGGEKIELVFKVSRLPIATPEQLHQGRTPLGKSVEGERPEETAWTSAGDDEPSAPVDPAATYSPTALDSTTAPAGATPATAQQVGPRLVPESGATRAEGPIQSKAATSGNPEVAARRTPAASDSSMPEVPVNVNTASVQELAMLPGVGPYLAERILQHRLEHGPFKNLDELRQIDGIGPSRFGKIKTAARISPPP